MTITAIITPNCRYLSLVVTGVQGSAQINITNGSYSHSVQMNIPANGSVNQLLYLMTTIGVQNGVFRITGTDAHGDEAQTGALGSCSLDCCIAKKVDKLLECGCGCLKCNDALTQAERVHLLIAGITADLANLSTSTAENAALWTTAEEKYKKALELCSDSCGCSC